MACSGRCGTHLLQLPTGGTSARSTGSRTGAARASTCNGKLAAPEATWETFGVIAFVLKALRHEQGDMWRIVAWALDSPDNICYIKHADTEISEITFRY